jgi:hypothetical protein
MEVNLPKAIHFVPSLGLIRYPHRCMIQGRGYIYALRESRHTGRQIFHQQRPWLRTSHSIRAPLVSGSSTAHSVLAVQALRRRRPFGICGLLVLDGWGFYLPPVAVRPSIHESPRAVLRCLLSRVLYFQKVAVKKATELILIGRHKVGCSEQMMVAPANVAPGLAACACADRPASSSQIFHRRTEPSHGPTPSSALAASRGHRVGAPETAAQKRRISRRAASLRCPALAIVLKSDAAMRPKS